MFRAVLATDGDERLEFAKAQRGEVPAGLHGCSYKHVRSEPMPNFRELRQCEVRGIPLLGKPVNERQRKGWNVRAPPKGGAALASWSTTA